MHAYAFKVLHVLWAKGLSTTCDIINSSPYYEINFKTLVIW